MAAIAPIAGLPLTQYAGVAGALPLNGGLLNAGLPVNGLFAGAYAAQPALLNAALPAQAPLVKAALPAQYFIKAAPAPLAAAPLPIAAAPVVQRQYAVPPPRVVEHAPAVETIHEKVEQHGYKIKY